MKSVLLETDPEGVRQSFQKNAKDVQDYISSIKLWIQSQKHLPEVPSK